MSRHAAMGGGDPIGASDWENEGGSIARAEATGLPVTIDLEHAPHL
jgi:hypothetical protein